MPDAAHGPTIVARTPEQRLASEIDATRPNTRRADGASQSASTRARSNRRAALDGPGGALILGDAGTGKSTVLANIARCALNAGADVDIHAIASTWSPLLLLPGLTSATTLAGIDKWAAEFFDHSDRARLVLVDDADRLDGEVFERLAALNDPRLVRHRRRTTRDLETPGALDCAAAPFASSL